MGKRKQSPASWRKRGAPIEEASQAARRKRDQDKRTGGSISSLDDASLFAVDASIAKPSASALGKKRVLRPERQLYTEKVVAANPNISVVTKPRVASAKPGALSSGALQLRGKLAKVSKKAALTLTHRAARTAALVVAGPAAPPTDALDIWGGSTTVAARVPRACQRNAAQRAPEPSVLAAAVARPSEGASWNPSFESHQQLLAEATAHEMKRARTEKEHHRMPKGMFARKPWEEEEDEEEEEEEKEGWEEAETEESEDEDDDEDKMEEDDDDEEEDGEEGPRWHVDRKALTSGQKMKRQRAKEREAEEAKAKAERKRAKQLDRTGALLAEIKKDERKLISKQESEKEIESKRTRKFGGKRYQAKREDVLLSDEQPESMRQMVAEGSLLIDRFESMKARNMIETRDKRPTTKRKVRAVLRESAKGTKYKSPHGWAGKMPAWV